MGRAWIVRLLEGPAFRSDHSKRLCSHFCTGPDIFANFSPAHEIFQGYDLNMLIAPTDTSDVSEDLRKFVNTRRFGAILADPPWQFQNRTGKVAPEHKRLSRYGTMSLPKIKALPVVHAAAPVCHLYLWVPNALLPDGLEVMKSWGFQYKSNIIWHKIRKDGGSDGRGVGFYFRNVTEILLFGIRGKNARTLAPGRSQVNCIATRKREHSRKPDEQYALIESCSPGPFLEMFARGNRENWASWGNQAEEYAPTWTTYANHSQSNRGLFPTVQ